MGETVATVIKQTAAIPLEVDMKNLTNKFLLLLCLATAPLMASADDRFDGRYDRPAARSAEWRLGEFRGDRRGYEML